MNSAENPEFKKELAKEALRKIAEFIDVLPEGGVDQSAQDEIDRLYAQYNDLSGNELTPDEIAEAIDALPEE